MGWNKMLRQGSCSDMDHWQLDAHLPIYKEVTNSQWCMSSHDGNWRVWHHRADEDGE